jgi:hypothetical protein
MQKEQWFIQKLEEVGAPTTRAAVRDVMFPMLYTNYNCTRILTPQQGGDRRNKK